MSLQVVALRLIFIVGVLQGLNTVVRGDCDDGVCVPLTECKNYHLEGVISIRLQDSDCEHYLDVCCDQENLIKQENVPVPDLDSLNQEGIPEKTTTTTTTTNNPVEIYPEATNQGAQGPEVRGSGKFGECGIRNIDGVGFTVSDAQHQEAQFGEFPWMVAILQYDPESSGHKYSCGGSLIAPNAVLTAAHCVLNKAEDSLLVRAGEWDTQTTNEIFSHQEQKVSRVITHEHFNQKAMANDIAILLLEEPLTADDNVQLACLPPQGEVFESDECFAAGWGKANFDAQSYQAILKKLQLAMVPKAECQAALQATRLGPRFRLHNSFVCAGGQQGVDTCTGDGGSPLVCPVAGQDNKYYQAGIVTWGIDCGQEGIPGVYVRTSLYTDWINEKLRQVQDQAQAGEAFNYENIGDEMNVRNSI